MGRVCETGGSGIANSDRSPTCFTSQPGQVDWTLTPCLCWTPHRCLPLSCGADVRLASSVLSSPRHILLIGFFGDFFWEKPSSSRPSVSIRLRRPRARDERCAKHRLVEYFLDSCLGSRLFVRSRRFFMACPWIPLEEMEVVRSHPNRENLTSRTCCVWGNIVVPEHTPPRARPFHSQTVQTQASPFHLSRGVIRSITLFFGWDICSSLSSSSFGVLTACSADSLVQSSLPSLAQGLLTSLFHCHRVPDAFQLRLFGFVEVHHRGPLACRSSIGTCSISGVFS